ncbi:DUF6270 domain-containing protein [Niallia sp. JL1B1071]|uniref:DUF6270 domain-containing protein n=1 Tax=Niallia tiangongensis TaxID=3237105 RepID=UPI0037DCFA4F
MPYKIAVIGSCVSRDVFNSNIIPDYKDLYEVVSTVWQTSIPSLVSKKVKLTDEDMELSKELSKHRLNTLKRDIKKKHFKELLESEPDFIIIDFFADIRYGYVKLNSSENYYLTNNPNGFRHTRFFKEKKYGKTYNVHKNNRFYEFFYKSFDKFYHILKEELPNTKILINGFVEAYGYIGPEKYPLSYDEETQREVLENNKEYLSIYKHIEGNYSDITVIEMSKKMYFGDPEHMFGNAPYHMTREYYNDLYNSITQQVLKMEQIKK